MQRAMACTHRHGLLGIIHYVNNTTELAILIKFHELIFESKILPSEA